MNSLDRLNLIDDIKKKSSYRREAPGPEAGSLLLTEYRLELAGGCGLTMRALSAAGYGHDHGGGLR